VIIHKLTEDILAWEENERASKRVERLLHFCHKYNCQLVDDPRAVRTVLSRAAIASKLMSLQGLTTVSGIQVSTPPFSTSAHFTSLRYPVIAKPLTAAGTKSSHSMKVLLRKPRHEVFQEPLLFQEYINHDAVLYKIYVLGDNISVFERSSLPNLPKDQSSTLDAVEFDSQRHPYPSLASFGFDQAAVNRSTLSDRLTLTSAEIQPVVNALKEAFRLQLFGFDVIYGMGKLWIGKKRSCFAVSTGLLTPSARLLHS
jgi:inositol-1,3,4-trisphosphate 5/6-kinase / inositol-tetrakisphosphate 1-kinase